MSSVSSSSSSWVWFSSSELDFFLGEVRRRTRSINATNIPPMATMPSVEFVPPGARLSKMERLVTGPCLNPRKIAKPATTSRPMISVLKSPFLFI